MRRFGYFLLCYSVIDGLASSLLFCRFDAAALKLSLARLTYFDFKEDLIDIWFLALLRCYIVCGIALGALWRPIVAVLRIPVCIYCLSGFTTISLLYTLVKMLVTTESFPLLLEDSYFWLHISWSFFTNFFLLGFGYYWLTHVRTLIKSESESYISDGNCTSTENLLVKDETTSKSLPTKTSRKSGIFRLLSFSKPDAHILFLAFIFLLVAAVADVLTPNYIGQVISGIVINQSSSEFIRAIVMFTVISIASTIATGLRGGLFSIALARLARRIRHSLFAAVLGQDIEFFDQTRTGDIMSRLSADVATMTDSLSLNLNIFLRNFVKAIGIAVMMFSLSWRLSLITIAGLPLIAITNQIFGDLYEKLSSAIQDAISKTSQVAEEAISNMRTVLSLAGEAIELERYSEDLYRVYKLQIREAIVYASSIWTTVLLELGLTIATLYYGGHLVMTHNLRGGGLITFLIYQIDLGNCLQSMGSVYTGLMQAVGASRKVIEYLDRKPAQQRSGPNKSDNIRGHIEFQNVHFSYPNRKDAPVLKNISFVAEPGQVVALVGKSGSGKSSCLALLERFYDPSSGQVLLDGKPVGAYDHGFLHRVVAIVAQEPVLFSRSIRENIVFATESTVSDEDIVEAATMADAGIFISNLPKKYETECGEKGTQLSAGQKQRIAIARALIRKPRVLILDEATSALDATAEAAVQDTLSKNMAGRTVLVVAHRLSTIRNANCILVIDNGQIVEKGTHDELIALNSNYATLVRKQLNAGSLNEDRDAMSKLSSKTVTTVAEVHSGASYKVALATSPSIAFGNDRQQHRYGAGKSPDQFSPQNKPPSL